MKLNPAARKEVRWPFTADVPDLSAADVWLADAWHTAVVDTETSEVVLLLAGPDVEEVPHPPGTVVLPRGLHFPLIRFEDNPEIVVEDAGVIVVT